MSSEDKSFSTALAVATSENRVRDGIGTLSEKTLHSFLKNYLEPDSSFHEIKVGRYVADIKKDGYITEIQTGNKRCENYDTNAYCYALKHCF